MRHLLDPNKYNGTHELYDNPAIMLEDAQYCLEAVTYLFMQDRPPELTDRQAAGSATILQAVSSTMEDARSQILDLTLKLDRATSVAPAQPAPRGTEYPRVDPSPAEVKEEPEARPARARRRA